MLNGEVMLNESRWPLLFILLLCSHSELSRKSSIFLPLFFLPFPFTRNLSMRVKILLTCWGLPCHSNPKASDNSGWTQRVMITWFHCLLTWWWFFFSFTPTDFTIHDVLSFFLSFYFFVITHHWWRKFFISSFKIIIMTFVFVLLVEIFLRGRFFL